MLTGYAYVKYLIILFHILLYEHCIQIGMPFYITIHTCPCICTHTYIFMHTPKCTYIHIHICLQTFLCYLKLAYIAIFGIYANVILGSV